MGGEGGSSTSTSHFVLYHGRRLERRRISQVLEGVWAVQALQVLGHELYRLLSSVHPLFDEPLGVQQLRRG